MRKLLFNLFIIHGFSVFAQQVPVGFSFAEEFLRREQLLGRFDSTISFTYRPMVPLKILDSALHFHSSNELFSIKKKCIKVNILPIQKRTEINTGYPFGGNNGSLMTTRGYQTMVSPGIYGNIGPLSIVYRPEFSFSQNLSEGFPAEFSQAQWAIYYQRYLNHIDKPEQIGSINQTSYHPGQSGIFLDLGFNRIGFSTENMWLGPSRFNPINLGNNAGGFRHVKIAAKKPVNVGIGHLEYLIAIGQLGSTGQLPLKADSAHSRYFRPRTKERRLLSVVHISFRPKLLNGLVVGGTRSIQSYTEKIDAAYFNSFTGFFRNTNDGQGNFDRANQIASAFARYSIPVINTEVYLEWARNDAAWNLRDFIMQPEHSSGYTFGIQKIFVTGVQNWQVAVERTKLERAGLYLYRRAEPIFYANGQLRHGHTNIGQLLGAPIGTGSNALTLEINKLSNVNMIGVLFTQVSYNRDIANTIFGNSAFDHYWNEYSLGIQGNKWVSQLMIDWRIMYNHSFNYYWQNNPSSVPNGLTEPVTKGNLHASINLTYLF